MSDEPVVKGPIERWAINQVSGRTDSPVLRLCAVLLARIADSMTEAAAQRAEHARQTYDKLIELHNDIVGLRDDVVEFNRDQGRRGR